MKTHARLLALLAAFAAIPLAAPAQGVYVPAPEVAPAAPLSGLRAHVARELPRYGYPGVDVTRLTGGQVATINSLIHSGRSHGDIASLISGVLRPGLLQRQIDRF